MENKKNSFIKLVCLVLAMLIVLPNFAFISSEAANTPKYGYVTMDKSLFRKKPGSSDYWDYLSAGWVAEILGTQKNGRWTFYKVRTGTPRHPNNKYDGYLREDVFRPMTEEELAAYLNKLSSPSPSSAPGGTFAADGYIKITKHNTNLRATADGPSIRQLPKGTILPFKGGETRKGNHTWINVYDASGTSLGFVRDDCYNFVTKDGKPAPSPAPTPLVNPELNKTLAYVLIDGTNIRQSPGGYGVTALLKGSVVEVTGPAYMGWFPVKYKDYVGYLAIDSIKIMTEAEKRDYVERGIVPNGAGDNPIGTEDGILKLLKPSDVYDSIGGTKLHTLPAGTELRFYGATQEKDGVKWQLIYDEVKKAYHYIKLVDNNVSFPSNTPAPGSKGPGSAAGSHVKLILDRVFFRREPAGKSYDGLLRKGTIIKALGAIVEKGGYQWVAVEHLGKNGYIRSDCLVFTDSNGNPVNPGAVPTPSEAPTPDGAIGLIELIKGGVNLRQEADGKVITRLARGTRLGYYGIAQKGGYGWYYVMSQKGNGYIRSDMAKIISSSQGPIETPSPSGSYIMTTKTNVNLRKTPDGLTVAQLPRQTVLGIYGQVANAGGYSWYPVKYNGLTGYLRGDCVRTLSDEEVNNYISKGTIPEIKPGGGSSPAPSQPSMYLAIRQDNVKFRESASLDSAAIKLLNSGDVLPYLSTAMYGGHKWYIAQIEGKLGYILESDARVMTQAEYEAWKKTLPNTPSPSLKPEDMSDVAVTTMSKVNVRKAASMKSKSVTQVFRMGDRVKLTGALVSDGSYRWYPVIANGVKGFIRADLLRVLSKAEAGGGDNGGSTKPQATYRTLRKGMVGEDVKRLQLELIKLKFLADGTASGVYDSMTEAAVREYQKTANLYVDGVAGQKTQDSLYGTQPPIDSNPGQNGIFPVEKSDWFKGDIAKVWKKGRVARITDVKTGISFNVKRWSGGRHADVEPLTAEDTAKMCKIYGVRFAQQISDKNLYQRRPLWVTIDGRSFAASMFGFPHNYPEGDTIPDNEFNGQFCIHFVNSRLHTRDVVDKDHQAAIQYAYDHAPKKK